MIAPRTTLQILYSNGQYGDVMPRLAGIVLTALGLFIVQLIRLRIHTLYTTAVAIRVFILVALSVLYFSYSDPLFIVLFGVVGFGVLLTSTSYLMDKREMRKTTTMK